MLYQILISLLLFRSALAQLFSGQQNILHQDRGRDDVISLHKSLLEINSVWGNEKNVSLFLEDYLKQKGLTVELQTIEEKPLRQNVYAYLGKRRNTDILLTSHIDTNKPFLPYEIKGDEIHGRGACDAKGSVAAQIFAFVELLESNLIKEGDISLLFVVGEEYNGIGMKSAVENLSATWRKAAIFGEPTENKLGVGHKGNYRFDVNVRGKSAHSGYPELGYSANELLLRQCIKLLDSQLPHSDLLGPTTVNIGTIHGGVGANIIPDKAKAEIYIRVADRIEEVFELTKTIFNTDHSELTVVQKLEPQFLEYDVPGFECIPLAYATDIPYFGQRNIKRYLYGPGSFRVAHTESEFVTFKDMYDSVQGYKKLILFNL